MRYFVSKERENVMNAPYILTIVDENVVKVFYLAIGLENFIMNDQIRNSIRVNDIEITRKDFYKEMEVMREYRSKFINN